MFTINFVGEQKKARIFLTWTWQKLLWKALKNKEWIEMKFKDNFTYLFWLLNLISLTGIKTESNHFSQKNDSTVTVTIPTQIQTVLIEEGCKYSSSYYCW